MCCRAFAITMSCEKTAQRESEMSLQHENGLVIFLELGQPGQLPRVGNEDDAGNFASTLKFVSHLWHVFNAFIHNKVSQKKKFENAEKCKNAERAIFTLSGEQQSPWHLFDSIRCLAPLGVRNTCDSRALFLCAPDTSPSYPHAC